jgi:hypothetical protein
MDILIHLSICYCGIFQVQFVKIDTDGVFWHWNITSAIIISMEVTVVRHA